jgi:hypothetical protein
MKSKGIGEMLPPAPVKMKDGKKKIKDHKFKDDVEGEIKMKGGKKKGLGRYS